MPFSERISRHTLTVLTAWLIAVWAALISWAQHAQFGLESDAPIAANQILLLAHGLLFAAALILPLILLLSHRSNPSLLRASSLIQRFQSPAWGLALLQALSLSLLYHAFAPPSRIRTFVGLATGLLVAGLLIWLLYERQAVNRAQILLIGIWLSLLIFGLLTWRWWWLDEQPAAAYAPIYSGVMLLAFIPVLLIMPPLRAWAHRLVNGIESLPISIAAVCLWLIIAARITIGLLTHTPTHFTHTLTLIEIPLIGACVIRLIKEPTVDPNPAAGEGAPSKLGLGFVIAIYLIVGLLSVPSWIGAVNFDGYAYLQIARSYANGDFIVRGLWSPLMSWLLAPFMALGVHPVAAQRVGVVLNGLIWIILSDRLALRFELRPLARLGMAGAVAAFALRYTFWPVTPDGLAAMILAAYFVLVTSSAVPNHPLKIGILVGILGALAYYAKYFNIGFVPAHLLFSVALLWLGRARLPRLIKFVGASFATMLLIIAPWVVLLSLRYGMPTASIAGVLNRANLNPARDSRINNCASYPLCTQPDDVLFPWEDPDPAVYMPYSWSALDTWEHLELQLNIIRLNLWYFTQDQGVEMGGLILAALAAVALAVLAASHLTPHQRNLSIWLIGTILIYLGGHLTVNAGDFRYFYALAPLGFIAVYRWVQALCERIQASGVSTQTANALMAALLIAPIIMVNTRPSTYMPILGPFHAANRCSERDALAMRESLRAPMASTSDTTHAVSYHTQVRSYGVLTGAADQVNAVLGENGVNTYVISANDPLATQLVSEYGYTVIAELPYCNHQFIILHVAD